MKLLVVDVGNTSTAVGLWSGGRVTRVSHIDGGGDASRLAAESLLSRIPAPEGRACRGRNLRRGGGVALVWREAV